MQSLDIFEAAEFLKMHPEVLRRKARAGIIPGKKAGKRWIFIKEHLADWVSGRYPDDRRELRVIDGRSLEETRKCRSTNAVKRGGYNSPTHTEDAYSDLLRLK